MGSSCSCIDGPRQIKAAKDSSSGIKEAWAKVETEKYPRKPNEIKNEPFLQQRKFSNHLNQVNMANVERINAAIKIQAAFRGHSVRCNSQVKMLETKPHYPPHHSEAANSVPGEDPLEQKKDEEMNSIQRDLGFWVANRLRNKVRLSKITRHIEKFIPQEVVRDLGKENINDVDLGDFVIVHRTVLMCDIRRFTSMCEKLGMEATYEFLNQLSSRILPIIRENGGVVDKFIGDAIVALFQKAGNGLSAGILILKCVADFNEEREASGFDPIKLGIGLHTGPIMLGTVGNESRMDATALGNTINLVARIETFTKSYGVDFICSHASQLACIAEGKGDVFKFRHLDNLFMNKQTENLIISEVCGFAREIPETSKRQSFIQAFETSLNLFRLKNCEEAKLGFLEGLKLFPFDKPSFIYIDRCKSFLKTGNCTSKWNQEGDDFESTAPNPLDSTSQCVGHSFHIFRLVFASIFHMQKNVLLRKEREAAEKGASLTVSTDELPSQKCLDKEKKASAPLTEPNEILKEKVKENVEDKFVKNHIPKLAPVDPSFDPKEMDPLKTISSPRDTKLISWVLSGFQNHNEIEKVTKSYERFIPNSFLKNLGKQKHIENLVIGESLIVDTCVMFCEFQGIEEDHQLLNHPSVEPYVLIRRFNSITRKIVPIISENNGYIDKFFGTAMLALFPTQEDAYLAGTAMIASCQENPITTDASPGNLKIPSTCTLKIGINTGAVVLGTVGDDSRMDGTVIGNTVNVASRLLTLSKIYGIEMVTISPNRSGKAIGEMNNDISKEIYNLRELDYVKVPGKKEPLWLCQVYPANTLSKDFISLYYKALNFYFEKDFLKALSRFEKALELSPNDNPTSIFIKRCKELIATKKTAEWNGSYHCVLYKV